MLAPIARRLLLAGFVALVACAPEPRPLVVWPAVPVTCEPATADGPPFDRGAAAAVSRVDVTSCRRPGAPRGTARVEMVFCPADGTTHGATVIEEESLDDDTRKCIEQRFVGLRVPPFGGKAVHVKRAVTVSDLTQ